MHLRSILAFQRILATQDQSYIQKVILLYEVMMLSVDMVSTIVTRSGRFSTVAARMRVTSNSVVYSMVYRTS